MEAIARRVKDDWLGGSDVPIAKVITTQLAAWLASYRCGVPSYNLHSCVHPRCVRAGGGGSSDRCVVYGSSKIKKAKKPIRKTLSSEEFQVVIADIRAQPYNAEATRANLASRLAGKNILKFRTWRKDLSVWANGGE